jgi:HD domain
MPEPELEGLTNFLYEMGLLKRYKRTGWWIAGIDNPESIAEHSFRTAIIGYLLAVMEGADPARTAALCLFHDTQETRLGDVPSVGKAYVITAPNPEVTADQVAGFPAAVGQAVRKGRRRVRGSRDPGGAACQGCRQAGVPDPGPRVPGAGSRGCAALDRDLGGRAPVEVGSPTR